MSNSVGPHRPQLTRLPRPWDSPGKNTGVGCHFLLQCMKVKSESEVAQSCLTLSDSMDCSPPGSSVHGIFQARVLEWGAIAFSVSSLSHTANFYWLSMLHMVVYMLPCYSLHSSHPLLPLPSPCTSVCSLCLHLHCCPINRFISTIFLDSIYMCYYRIFVFMFLTYFTLYNML